MMMARVFILKLTGGLADDGVGVSRLGVCWVREVRFMDVEATAKVFKKLKANNKVIIFLIAHGKQRNACIACIGLDLTVKVGLKSTSKACSRMKTIEAGSNLRRCTSPGEFGWHTRRADQ